MQLPEPTAWLPGAKIRDGLYGTVSLALSQPDGELFAVEQLDCDVPADVLARITQPSNSSPHANIVTYLGHSRKDGKTYLHTEYVPGGTLRGFIASYKAIATPLARSILRHTVAGISELRRRGLALVLVDIDTVYLDNAGTAKVAPPLVDLSTAGPALPSALTMLPEVVLGRRQHTRGADVWLLGVLAVQMLTGKIDVDVVAVAAGIRKAPEGGSSLELLMPGAEDVLDDPQAVDFLRKCLTINTDERPTISALRDHPFLQAQQE